MNQRPTPRGRQSNSNTLCKPSPNNQLRCLLAKKTPDFFPTRGLESCPSSSCSATTKRSGRDPQVIRIPARPQTWGTRQPPPPRRTVWGTRITPHAGKPERMKWPKILRRWGGGELGSTPGGPECGGRIASPQGCRGGRAQPSPGPLADRALADSVAAPRESRGGSSQPTSLGEKTPQPVEMREVMITDKNLTDALVFDKVFQKKVSQNLTHGELCSSFVSSRCGIDRWQVEFPTGF